MGEEMLQHCSDHERCMKVFGEALFGTGDPDRPGVVFSMRLLNNNFTSLSEQITKHRKDDKAKIEDVYDAIVGGTKEKGIKTYVKEHEDFIQAQKNSIGNVVINI